ncbi:MAG: argininosuccinate lyase, partial [Actinomycetota bacterium]
TTDLAEWLVRKGMPFRKAHALVVALVQQCISTGTPLADLAAASPDFGAEAAALVAPGVGVSMRRSPGGAGPKPALVQREKLLAAIGVARREQEDLRAL